MNGRYVVLCVALAMLGATMMAQPISVTVNGVPTGASLTSGDLLTWAITVPTGGISINDLWVDVDQNGRVDAGSDRLIFRFTQQDGVTENDGPADSDGQANGVIFTQFNAGLAPAHWLMVVADGSGSDTAAFTVNPLVSPVVTISGQVVAPVGVNKANILIQAESAAELPGMKPFWHALTDVNGNYLIQMGGTPTMANPWHVRVESSMLGRLVPTRIDTLLSISGPSYVINFELVLGTILTGRVLDQSGDPVVRAYPHVHPSANPEGEGHLGSETDLNGYYRFAVPPGSWLLHFNKDGYKDQWWNVKTGMMDADVIVTTTQDTIASLNGTLVKAGEIRGTVRNYGSPTQATVYLFTTPGENIMTWRGTNDDGSYSFTVDPGTYYVKFQKEMSVQYWDHSTMSPGNAITITGTETVSNIDADFSIGTPPPPPPPVIVRVWDYPFDNGGKVFIKFRGIEQYLDESYHGDGPYGVEAYTIWRLQKDGPVYVGTVPAAWDSVYTGIVPTLVDSNRIDASIPDPARWSRYVVKAHFLFNALILPSRVDSGYSLDNMAPNVPGGVGSAVAGTDVRVLWDPSADEDLRYYNVYRGTTENFSVMGMTPVMRTTASTFTDVGAATGSYYYRITATDFAGNESDPSMPVSSSGTTAIRNEGTVPTSLALGQNYPNPFNPATTVTFDVPSTATVRLEVFNTLGQVVAELVNGEVATGRHTVRFDAAGLPSGLYLVRMQSGEFVAMRKINLIK